MLNNNWLINLPGAQISYDELTHEVTVKDHNTEITFSGECHCYLPLPFYLQLLTTSDTQFIQQQTTPLFGLFRGKTKPPLSKNIPIYLSIFKIIKKQPLHHISVSLLNRPIRLKLSQNELDKDKVSAKLIDQSDSPISVNFARKPYKAHVSQIRIKHAPSNPNQDQEKLKIQHHAFYYEISITSNGQTQRLITNFENNTRIEKAETTQRNSVRASTTNATELLIAKLKNLPTAFLAQEPQLIDAVSQLEQAEEKLLQIEGTLSFIFNRSLLYAILCDLPTEEHCRSVTDLEARVKDKYPEMSKLYHNGFFQRFKQGIEQSLSNPKLNLKKEKISVRNERKKSELKNPFKELSCFKDAINQKLIGQGPEWKETYTLAKVKVMELTDKHHIAKGCPIDKLTLVQELSLSETNRYIKQVQRAEYGFVFYHNKDDSLDYYQYKIDLFLHQAKRKDDQDQHAIMQFLKRLALQVEKKLGIDMLNGLAYKALYITVYHNIQALIKSDEPLQQGKNYDLGEILKSYYDNVEFQDAHTLKELKDKINTTIFNGREKINQIYNQYLKARKAWPEPNTSIYSFSQPYFINHASRFHQYFAKTNSTMQSAYPFCLDIEAYTKHDKSSPFSVTAFGCHGMESKHWLISSLEKIKKFVIPFGERPQLKLAKKISQSNSHIKLVLGDNFYDCGVIKPEVQFEEHFYKTYKSIADYFHIEEHFYKTYKGITYYFHTLGNHDRDLHGNAKKLGLFERIVRGTKDKDKNNWNPLSFKHSGKGAHIHPISHQRAQLQIDHMYEPEQLNDNRKNKFLMPHSYYCLTGTNFVIIVLDSNIFAFDPIQRNWFKKVYTHYKNLNKLIILALHHPLVAFGKRIEGSSKGDKDLKKYILPEYQNNDKAYIQKYADDTSKYGYKTNVNVTVRHFLEEHDLIPHVVLCAHHHAAMISRLKMKGQDVLQVVTCAGGLLQGIDFNKKNETQHPLHPSKNSQAATQFMKHLYCEKEHGFVEFKISKEISNEILFKLEYYKLGDKLSKTFYYAYNISTQQGKAQDDLEYIFDPDNMAQEIQLNEINNSK